MDIRTLFVLSILVATSVSEGVDKNITWDYLTFAQLWPYSLCDAANLLKPDSCAIPKEVTVGWTIHGLWPSRNGELGPDSCVPADHFDLEKVKPIVDELLHHWPNLIPSEALYSLWQHEWTKHGTCAEQLESIKGEFKYFSSGLQLNERFKIDQILTNAGISPSDEPKHKANDISSAMQTAKGKRAQVHCLKAKQGDQTKWFLVDVRVCLDKQLNQIDCPVPKPGHTIHGSELLDSLAIPNVEQCPPNALLYYTEPRSDHYHDDEQHEMHSYAHKRREYGDYLGEHEEL